jgi:hypothetical protein
MQVFIVFSGRGHYNRFNFKLIEVVSKVGFTVLNRGGH